MNATILYLSQAHSHLNSLVVSARLALHERSDLIEAMRTVKA